MSTLGPIETLLNDSAITAIHMSPTKIDYHKHGQSHTHDTAFGDEAEFYAVVGAILHSANQALSADNSPVDCTLSDGTQVHATYNPPFMSLTKAV